MVVFDILEVSNDAKDLFIEAHINGANYYQGYTIEEIYINTDDNFLESGVNTNDYIYHETFSDSPTKISLKINCADLDVKSTITDFSTSLLFVYIKVKPVANDCTNCIPCGLDNEWTIGVTFDTGLLYNTGLSYIKELADGCSIPQGFNDFILNWEGFKLLIESEHYIDAIKLFNKAFKKSTKSITSSCGCYGKVSS